MRLTSARTGDAIKTEPREKTLEMCSPAGAPVSAVGMCASPTLKESLKFNFEFFLTFAVDNDLGVEGVEDA